MKIFKLFPVIIIVFLFLSVDKIAYTESSEKKSPSNTLISDLDVQTRLKKPFLAIGEETKFVISVSAGKSVDVGISDFSDRLKGLVLEDSGQSKNIFFGRKFYTFWFILKSFQPGEYVISGIDILYKHPGEKEWRHILAPGKTIHVKSLLGHETDADIRDIKGPLAYTNPFKIIIFVSVVLFLLGLIAFYFLRQEKKFPLHMMRELAHIVALRKIKELKVKDLIGRGLIKEFYFYLSLIVRQYLEDRFNLRAPEMTTEEFLSRLKESPLLSNEHKIVLKEFLFHCDLVKFAKYAPSMTEIDSIVEAAINLIEQTKQEEIKNQEAS